MTAEQKHDLDPENLYPFSIVLPQAIEDVDKPNLASTRAYKALLTKLSGDVLGANHLAVLARGLLRGRLFTVRSAAPLGLYEAGDDNKGITFKEPAKLYENWGAYEDRVGPVFQEAMHNIIENVMAYEPPQVNQLDQPPSPPEA